jgi:pimeloyl-ACP methyl ester carboxylesterase
MRGLARELLHEIVSAETLMDDSLFPIRVPATIPGVSARTRRGLQYFYRSVTRLSPSLAARLALTLFTVPACSPPGKAERAILDRAERSRLHFRGRSLQVFHWPGSGPSILLAHGWSSRAARLAFLAEALSRENFRVVAFDAPGHGASSGIRSDVLLYREAMRAVLDRMGPVQAMVGHSLGARAAMLALRAFPLPDMRALVLIGIPPDVGYMLEQFELVLNLRGDVRRLLHKEFERFFGAPPEVHSPEDAARLQVPVLVMHDLNDDVAPVAHARALARQLPRGTLLLTQDLNHCGPLSDPVALAEVVHFIKRNLAAGATFAPSTDSKYSSANRVSPRSGLPMQSEGTTSSNSRTCASFAVNNTH